MFSNLLSDEQSGDYADLGKNQSDELSFYRQAIAESDAVTDVNAFLSGIKF